MLAALFLLSVWDPTPSTPTATPKPLMSETAWIVFFVLIILFGLGALAALCWYFRCSRRFKKDEPAESQQEYRPIYGTFSA